MCMLLLLGLTTHYHSSWCVYMHVCQFCMNSLYSWATNTFTLTRFHLGFWNIFVINNRWLQVPGRQAGRKSLNILQLSQWIIRHGLFGQLQAVLNYKQPVYFKWYHALSWMECIQYIQSTITDYLRMINCMRRWKIRTCRQHSQLPHRPTMD